MLPIGWRRVDQQLIFTVLPLLKNNHNNLPLYTQDVPLISMANIFQNARLWEDALTVARMAVEIAPRFVVSHFTLANIYLTMVIQPFVFYSSFCADPPFHSAHVTCGLMCDFFPWVPVLRQINSCVSGQ